MSDAGADAVDGLERCREDRCFCPVKGGRDQYLAGGFAFLAGYLDVDSSDTPRPLEIPEVKVFAE